MIYNNTEPNGETLLACLLLLACMNWYERRYNITINDPAAGE